MPTGFLPIEDQGYLLASVQLPDGASLERTQKVLDQVTEIARKTPGVRAGHHHRRRLGARQQRRRSPMPASPTSSSRTGASAARARICCSLYLGLNQSLGAIEEARILVLPPPPIQGVGNAAGFTMQIELRDGSFDLAKLQTVRRRGRGQRRRPSRACSACMASFRASVPQYTVEVDRVKTETLQLTVDQVFSALAGYLGSSYVDQFNKFGRIFQIYVQADAQFRLRLEDIANLTVRNKDGNMIPLGTLVTITPTVGPSLISLYNLYPSATIIACRRPASRPARP